MNSHPQFCTLVILAGLACASSAPPAFAAGKACATLAALNPDNDGTLDLNEVKAAASALFDKLDADHDGTLTAKELQGRLSKKELTAGDPDKDKTLSKDEYLTIVEARFKAADVNGEGTIDCDEAKSSAGQALLRLLK